MTNDYLLLGSQHSKNQLTQLNPIWIENGRLRDKNRWFHWNGVSDFYLPRYYGVNELLVDSHLDFYRSIGRNGVRIFCSVNNNDGNYSFNSKVVDWLYNKCAQRGLIPEFCLFAGRGQYSLRDKQVIVSDFCQWVQSSGSDKIVLPQIVNEGQFNDFDYAADPDLLNLAEMMTSYLGHKNFSITDSVDDASSETTKSYEILAEYSNVLVWHPNRLKTSDPWRWVNHLKGFTDFAPGGVYLIVDEPMGGASVDAPNRDSNPNHHIAANCVANCCGMGYTYHYIPEQNPNFPGLPACEVATQIKASPDFTFKNAGTAGSAVKSFEGYTKVRVCDNGREAFAVGYGDPGIIDWDNGFQTSAILFNNEAVTLYQALK